MIEILKVLIFSDKYFVKILIDQDLLKVLSYWFSLTEEEVGIQSCCDIMIHLTNLSDEIVKKVLNSNVLTLILDQWQDKLIFIAQEKVLQIFINLTKQISESLLEQTLKTGVMNIIIKELNEQNDMKLKQELLNGLKNLLFLAQKQQLKMGGKNLLCEYFRANLSKVSNNSDEEQEMDDNSKIQNHPDEEI